MRIADKVGAAGIYTLVPDFFHGDPYVSGRNLSDWKKQHQPRYEVPHLRIADKVGAAGIYTLVPDFFHGDPYVSGRNLSDWKKQHQPRYEVPHLRIADKVGAAGIYTLVPDFFHGDPYVSGRNLSDWKKQHQPINGTKDAKEIIKSLQRKGITKIGAAGFCWGGKVAVDLAKSSYIQAAVLLHPTNVTAKDIQGIKVPISILEGQKDASSPPSLLEQYKSALKAKPKGSKVDSYIKIFPGAGHGWTTKYNDTDAFAVKRAEEAHKDMLDWFLKYLK
ncbi:hypothetical protein OROGR_025358 [Orobanche gracilis]